MKNKFLAITMLLLAGLNSCSSNCNCEHINKKGKDGEILYAACKYVIKNQANLEPINPCDLKIREIKEDTLNGKSIYQVTLTCCYMGDRMLIDKKTKEVLSYQPSDK